MKQVARPLLRLWLLAATLGLAACDFQQQADVKFGDQHFKTAIALIELHKVRTGSYPASLDELRFTGAWDGIATSSVDYRKLDTGYELNVTRGWIGKPEIQYPPEFWRGLGLVRSNLRPAAAPTSFDPRTVPAPGIPRS